MRKFNLGLFILLCLSNSNTYASGFDGFSISGEIVHNSANGVFVDNINYDADKDKILGAININYSFSIQKDFFMQIGVSFEAVQDFV